MPNAIEIFNNKMKSRPKSVSKNSVAKKADQTQNVEFFDEIVSEVGSGIGSLAGFGTSAIGNIGGGITGTLGSLGGTLGGAAVGAIESAGLGALAALGGRFASSLGVNVSGVLGGLTGGAMDKRARLRPFDNFMAQDYCYGYGIMSILRETQGLVWPYTPQIQIQQQVTYASYANTHVNQEFKAYSNTQAFHFTCSGPFTVQNEREKQYALACIHFLRTNSKMNFGVQGGWTYRGTPPPILKFSAWGPLMFNDLPVIIESFTIDLPAEVDYLQSNLLLAEAWLPAKFTISVSMTVQKTPSQLRNDFSLSSFASGSLLLNKGWF